MKQKFLTEIATVTVLISLTIKSKVCASEIIVVFRNDDICAFSDVVHEKTVMRFFEKHGIPQIFGIIPNVAEDIRNERCSRYHLLSENEQLLQMLRKWYKQGLIEIALHGYTHKTNLLHPTKVLGTYSPVNPEGYSEFRGLPYKEQLYRIEQGKKLLEGYFHVPIKIFIPPWNSYDNNTLIALRTLNFNCISGALYEDLDYRLFKDIILIKAVGVKKAYKVLQLANEFVKHNRYSVLIVILYHSGIREEVKLLKPVLNKALQLGARFPNFGDIINEYGPELRKIGIINSKTTYIRKVGKLLSLVGVKDEKNPFALYGFTVLNAEFYLAKERMAKFIWYMFYLITIVCITIFLFSLSKKFRYKS